MKVVGIGYDQCRFWVYFWWRVVEETRTPEPGIYSTTVDRQTDRSSESEEYHGQNSELERGSTLKPLVETEKVNQECPQPQAGWQHGLEIHAPLGNHMERNFGETRETYVVLSLLCRAYFVNLHLLSQICLTMLLLPQQPP